MVICLNQIDEIIAKEKVDVLLLNYTIIYLLKFIRNFVLHFI